jgi:Uma2 family endonuclease
MIWRLTVRQYHEMVRRGILTDDDPVELLQGLLVTKMPKNPPHRIATGLLRDELRALCPPGWYVDTQEPITTDDSEPEPDVAIIRGDTKDYAGRHPGAGDVGLVAEVADTTLERDRTAKKSAYGRAGIGVYWIVNLVDRRIEVYSEATGPDSPLGYRQHRQYGMADEVPVIIAGKPVGGVQVSAVLP